MSEKKEKQEVDFEQMMEQRIRKNFAVDQQEVKDVSNERLREMNKKLPSWSLEPPFSFLKS